MISQTKASRSQKAGVLAYYLANFTPRRHENQINLRTYMGEGGFCSIDIRLPKAQDFSLFCLEELIWHQLASAVKLIMSRLTKIVCRTCWINVTFWTKTKENK